MFPFDKRPLILMAALVGSFALVGILVVVLNTFIAIQTGVTLGYLYVMGAWALGGLGSALIAWLTIRRFEKNVTKQLLKQLGLDK